jgi:hypothetical protein
MQKPVGENSKAVWVKFSTLSWAVLLLREKCVAYMNASV